MKKNTFYTLTALLCMAAAMLSCSGEEEIITPETPTVKPTTRTITVRLMPEAETRIMLDDNAALLWKEDDKVSYYTSPDGKTWSVSKTADIDYQKGTFTATVQTGDKQIKVVYPAVKDGSAFSETQYEVKKDQTGGEVGDLLPMYAQDNLPEEGTSVDVKYHVNGAVVKVTLAGIPSSAYTTRIRRIQLGEYFRNITDNTAEQTDTYYFVLPKGNSIDYTSAVYTTDYAVSGTDYNFVTGHVYQRNTQMKSDFEAKAYAMTADVSNKEKYYDISLTGTREGHDWVDLGILKSDYDHTVAARSANDFRMLFSTVNIGSDTPEKSTLYFRWGETGIGWRYSKSNGSNQIQAEPYHAVFKKSVTHTLNAYVEAYNGTVILNYRSSDTEEDIQGKRESYLAQDGSYYRIYYGDIASYYTGWSTGWCMMNKKLAEYLLSDNVKNISKTWTTKNGVSGYEFKNVITDATVFFPAVGYLNGDTSPKDTDHGYYWLSVTVKDQPTSYLMDMTSSKISISPEERFRGCSVRPISMLRYISTKLTNTANGLQDFEYAGSMF